MTKMVGLIALHPSSFVLLCLDGVSYDFHTMFRNCDLIKSCDFMFSLLCLIFPICLHIFAGIVSVQLLGTIGWLIYENPDIKEIHPQPLTAVLTCKVSTFSLIMSLVYNMVLILLCTLYAFKTRKIPENFNEAKYIGFTMYSTCIVWLAFLPIYFGTNNDYKVKLFSLIFIYF